MAVSLMQEEDCFARVTKAIATTTGLSLPGLLAELLPSQLGQLVSLACNGPLAGLESRLAALIDLLGPALLASARPAIEACFQAFLYDYGQRLALPHPNASAILFGLRQLLAFCLLAPPFTAANGVKIVGVLADILKVTRGLEFRFVVAVFERRTGLLGLPRVLAVLAGILEGGREAVLPSEEDMSELERAPWRIGAELLTAMSVSHFAQQTGQLSDKAKLVSYLRKILADCDETALAMRLRLLLLTLLPDIPPPDTLTLTPFTRTARDADSLYCFDQLHRIRFSLLQVKALLDDHHAEADEHRKNALAYTLQALVRYLGLGQEDADIWDAFDRDQAARVRPFTRTQYRFDIVPEPVECPLVLHAQSQEEYVWRMFSYLTFHCALDMEHQAFLKLFAALMAIHGGKYSRIFAALVISGLVLAESFAETLIQEYIAASSMPSSSVNSVIRTLCIS